MNNVNEVIPIKLCVFSTMRTKDSSKVPGALLREVRDFGETLEHIILLYFHKNYNVKKLKGNVNVITIPYIDPKTPIRYALSIFASYLISIPVITRLALKYKINLFRADDILITGLPCLLVSKILKIRCIVSLYGDLEEVISYKIGKDKKMISVVLPIVRKVVKYVIRNSEACIVVNRGLEDIAKGFGSKKVLLTYPDIDLSIFNIRSNRKQSRTFKVLFVGRLEREKGPLNILKVAEILRDVDFIVAGYGSLEEEMERIIKAKKLLNVRLLGTINHDDLPELYHSVDVLLLPSYSEGMPIVMLEAMASELPVIVSKVGAVGEILEEENGGFAVMPGDIKDIVSKIQILIKDENLRESLGKRGRINVCGRFNNFIPTQIDLYKSIMTN